jgi:hypothetical protein
MDPDPDPGGSKTYGTDPRDLNTDPDPDPEHWYNYIILQR